MSCPGAPTKKRVIDLSTSTDDESVMDSPMAKHLAQSKRRRLAQTVISISSEESEEEEESEDLDTTDEFESSDSEGEAESDDDVAFSILREWNREAAEHIRARARSLSCNEVVEPIILDVVPPLVIQPEPVRKTPELIDVTQSARGSTRWVFTVNNYTQADYDDLVKSLPTQCEWAIVGKEIGGDNGVPHLQGIECFQLGVTLDCYCGHCHLFIK